MKKVAFYTNMPSPYRVAFFNLLGEHCDLDVFFEMDKSSLRDNSWQSYDFKNFNAHLVKGIAYSSEGAFCPGLTKQAIKGHYDINVVCDISSLTGLNLLFTFIRKKIPYIIEGDGAFNQDCSWLKAKIKNKIFQNASSLFYTSDEHKAYLKRFGALEERLFWYPFSSIFEKDILDFDRLKEIKRNQKEAKNLKEFTFLSVGRFLGLKDFETLIRAFCFLNKNYKNAKLVIIGGEPTPSYKAIIKENNCKNVSFLPFMSREELFSYMQAADCFCFPSLNDIWGLVINEAMANGLPIIASDGALAAVEMSKENQGIELYPKGDLKTLLDLMTKTIKSSKEELDIKTLENLKKIQEYTIEKMSNKHIELLNL